MLFLVCREENHSGDYYVRIETETPEKVLATEAAARAYCAGADRPERDEGSGNTTGFVIYAIDVPADDVPRRVARWDADTLAFD